jgi:hypothetical protein
METLPLGLQTQEAVGRGASGGPGAASRCPEPGQPVPALVISVLDTIAVMGDSGSPLSCPVSPGDFRGVPQKPALARAWPGLLSPSLFIG